MSNAPPINAPPPQPSMTPTGAQDADQHVDQRPLAAPTRPRLSAPSAICSAPTGCAPPPAELRHVRPRRHLLRNQRAGSLARLVEPNDHDVSLCHHHSSHSNADDETPSVAPRCKPFAGSAPPLPPSVDRGDGTFALRLAPGRPAASVAQLRDGRVAPLPPDRRPARRRARERLSAQPSGDDRRRRDRSELLAPKATSTPVSPSSTKPTPPGVIELRRGCAPASTPRRPRRSSPRRV